MKRNKKVLLCFMLSLAMIFCLFAGCESKPSEPLQICVDLTGFGYYGAPDFKNAVNNLMADLKLYGIKTEVTTRFIAPEGSEREMEIRKLKTEIMSGNGPDLFLIGQGAANDVMIFPCPEKAMQNELFLPLDRYLEHAKYMEPEHFLPAVREAGTWDGTQYILPMTYTFPATVFRAEDFSADVPMTWQEMAEHADRNVLAAANWARPGAGFGNHFIDTFDKIIDAREETVDLPESELQEHMRQILEVNGKYREEKLSGADGHFQANMCVSFNTFPHPYEGEDYFHGITPQDDVAIVPMFNSAGGVTASVASYLAISASTKHPKEAFEIADFLLSKNTQTGWLFQMMTATTALPVDTSLLVPGDDASLWEMTDQTYQAFLGVQDQISCVRLPSYLDYLFSEMYWNCYDSYFGYEDGDIDKILTDGYRSLQMFVSES